MGWGAFACGLLATLLGYMPKCQKDMDSYLGAVQWRLVFLLLTLFYWSIDVLKTQKWYFVLMVIGANSIAAYVIAHTIDSFISSSLYIHLGTNYAAILEQPTPRSFTGFWFCFLNG